MKTKIDNVEILLYEITNELLIPGHLAGGSCSATVLYEEHTYRLRQLLCKVLSELPKDILRKETKFGSRLQKPNTDFIKLLEQHILSVDTLIYGVFNNNIHEGSLTKSGYFALKQNDEVKLFSSFATAASFVCNKAVLNGWEQWFTMDNAGIERKLSYYRSKIS